MSVNKARLVMELNVTCPECEHDFDLFRSGLNDEGGLYHQVLDEDRWEIDADDRLEVEARCPECSVEFGVKGVEW
jgi:hypothetical protein